MVMLKKRDFNFYQSICLIYIAQIIAFAVHMIDAWHPFMFNWIDWLLYITCIAADILAGRYLIDIEMGGLSQKLKIKFKRLAIVESFMFITDVFMSYILGAVFVYLFSAIAKYVILYEIPLMIFKAIREDYVLKEDFKGAEETRICRRHYIQISVVFLVAFIIYVFKITEMIAYLFYLLMFIIWAGITLWSVSFLQTNHDHLMLVEPKEKELIIDKIVTVQLDEYEDSDNYQKVHAFSLTKIIKNNIHIFKKIAKVFGIAYIASVFISLVCQNIYHGGEYYLYDENGNKVSEQSSTEEFYERWDDSCRGYGSSKMLSFNYYLYVEENIMPTWTGLHKSRNGIIREDGKTNGKKFSKYLYIRDRNGCASDGEGHIIDISGNIIVDMPYSYKAKISNRTKLIRKLFPCNYSKMFLWGANDGYEDYGIYKLESGNYISEKGRIKYYSEVFDGEGTCDTQGHIILSPKYISIDITADLDVTVVANGDYTFDVYDGDGNCLTEDFLNINDIGIVKDAELIKFNADVEHDPNEENYNWGDMILDYQGNVIEYDVTIEYGDRYSDHITYYKDGQKYKIGADHVAQPITDEN